MFSNREQAVVDAALRDLYWGIDPSTLTPEETPRLEQLCRRLALKGGRGAAGGGVGGGVGPMLAEEIAGIYVDGVYGDVFNSPEGTSLDLRFRSSATAFDFFEVDDTFRGLWYALVLGAIYKKIRTKPPRERMIVYVDEFRFMAREPMLAELVMMLVKTARTLSTAIWVAEQNLFTFVHTLTGKAILENVEMFTLYKQTATAIKVAREQFPRLTEFHSFLMQTSKRGECISILGDDIHHLWVRPSIMELQEFKGS